MELRPAVQIHLRERFQKHMTLHPHKVPTAFPVYLQPRTEPGICFHDLPPAARTQGAILVTDAGITLAGMTIALAYERVPGTKRPRRGPG